MTDGADSGPDLGCEPNQRVRSGVLLKRDAKWESRPDPQREVKPVAVHVETIRCGWVSEVC